MLETSEKSEIRPSMTNILGNISDDKTLTIFNSIVLTNGERYVPLKEMKVTTRQYYSRISRLTEAGLIKRRCGKYSTTLLGKVVYDSQMTIGKTLNYYWKMKAIDTLEKSSPGVSRDEFRTLIDTLIDSPQVKDILMKEISSS